jgi:Flp pilus assembly protein TadG
MIKNKFVYEEKGSVLVLVGFMMLIMVGLSALVIDGGALYLEKSRLQKAVDAASLGGAMELPSNSERAKSEAQKIAIANNVKSDAITITIEDNNKSIKVEGKSTVLFTFARAIGYKEQTVSANAKVNLQALTAAKGAVPLGVEYDRTLQFGDPVLLKIGDSTVGNFGALVLTGPGAKLYETDLREGYDFQLKIGERLETQTGNIAGPTSRAINDRISRCPFGASATYQHYPKDCPRVVLAPVFRSILTTNNQVKEVEIVGFSSFYIESVIDTKEGSEISGRFIEKTTLGELSSTTQQNYGTFYYKLVE